MFIVENQGWEHIRCQTKYGSRIFVWMRTFVCVLHAFSYKNQYIWELASIVFTLALVVTLLRGIGNFFKIITNNPSTISRKHFWNPSISLQNRWHIWPKTEARCSFKIVLIKTKACNCFLHQRSFVFDNWRLLHLDPRICHTGTVGLIVPPSSLMYCWNIAISFEIKDNHP